MKIIHVCSEFFPLVKTGGLADVTGALPLAQMQEGIDVRLLLPGFPALMEGISDSHKIGECHTFAGKVRIFLGRYHNLPLYLIDAEKLYQRKGNPYVDENMVDYQDNDIRFALLGWVSCQIAKGLDPQWRPDLVHSHDWHAGLSAAYLALENYPARSLFTVHNLAYQGLFSPERLNDIALPSHVFQSQGLEFYGQMSYLKAGLFYSDYITTVSPTYAKEICTHEFGYGFEGLLEEKRRQQKLSGVLNGIDETIWNPATDKQLTSQFHSESLGNKRKNKTQMQAECSLSIEENTLLFGAVSRLTPQKGLDLLLDALPDLLELGGQFILLGSGDTNIENAFSDLAKRYPKRMQVIFGFNEALSHRIIAALDVIMVPSRFEPCGLTQLYGLKYGALPLVRATGGLADTVIDCRDENIADGSASGFVFERAHRDDLINAVKRAVELWQRPVDWQKIQARNMRQPAGWSTASQEYSSLYQHILDNN